MAVRYDGRGSRAVCTTLLALPLLLSACGEPSGPDPYALMEGENIYKAECASCHGAKLEGQPDWRTRRADGKLPAPPHDASGHTWHHPMAQLFAITKQGMVPPNAPEGYVSDMPGFAGKLTDRQIENVLLWIESTWPAEIKARRAEMLQRR
ncbi:c-type cytochrome [Zoogloea sp.]|uniref:c-type cytochrome n=1 Tax=Zoogloea sp. TaxID=49181 RepID=UPI001AD0AEF0|nr:c-type cytochrome [Zoogloea sp.]MBN8285450.1 cytochrome c [Zoogloea sp.]